MRPATLPEQPPGGCPLCPGGDAERRPALHREGEPWLARAVPSPLPLLGVEGELAPSASGPLERSGGVGAHEVIALGRACVAPAALDAATWTAGLRALQARMRDLRQDLRLTSMVAFLDHGVEAGARLAHPHLQLAALPYLPDELAISGRLMARHLARTGRELAQDLLEHELADGSRLVAADERAALLAAWAPMAPFEVWLLPRDRQPAFERADDATLASAGAALAALAGALERILGPSALNLTLWTLPDEPAFRWRAALIPRLEAPGGFAAATGWGAHGVWPEEAAAALRGALAGPGTTL